MANIINEVLITCGKEENVIDIESDASTMTGNTVSGTGTKKRNYFIKKSDLKTRSSMNKKFRKTNILELISEQRNGNKPNSVFQANMLALRTNRLKSSNFFSTVHPEVHVSDCEYIRSGQDGRCILGVWKGDQYDAILYKLVLNMSSRGSSIEDDAPSFLKNIEHVGPFFSKSDIKDICDTNCNNQKYVLYVGSYNNEDFFKQSSAVLCSFTNSSGTTGKQYVSLKELLCCCGSQNGDVFATGSEGVFVYQDQEFIFHNQYIRGVHSVEFNSTGNILYCGVKNSGITIFDRREAPWENSTIQMMNYSSGISETKLFSNENNMVVSGFDGSLSQIDLRKRETVLSYAGHAGANKKTPFSFSEHADLLCATGSDKFTRLWSLRSGSQLCAIEPPFKTKKAHSCLIVDENRWLVAIFQLNKMYIMETES